MALFHSFVQASRAAQPNETLVALVQGIERRTPSASPTEVERSLNRATWRCFQEVIQNASRSHEICHRYKINIARKIEKGDPLLPEFVEMFSLGIANAHIQDVVRTPAEFNTPLPLSEVERRMKELRELPPQETTRRVEALQLASYMPTHESYARWHQFFVPNFFRKDQHRLRLLENVGQLPSWDAYLELLCKKVIQHEMGRGTLVPAPSPEGGVEYYEVAKKIGTGAGLVAYMLKPVSMQSTLKPLLIFRPTQTSLASEDVIETYFNDLEQNIGHRGYIVARRELAEMMRDPAYQKIEAAGFSLGGAHLQRFLADHGPRVSQTIFFNDPSIDTHTASAYADWMNQLELPERISLVFYRTVGDRVHWFGHHHVGKGITNPLIDLKLVDLHYSRSHTISSKALHSTLLLQDLASCRVEEYRGEEVQQHLDFEQRGQDVLWYETRRHLYGSLILFSTIAVIYTIVRKILGLFGIELFRSSRVLDESEFVIV